MQTTTTSRYPWVATKVCRSCGTEKDAGAFHRNRRVCKECYRKENREYRRENYVSVRGLKEARKARARAWLFLSYSLGLALASFALGALLGRGL